MTADERSTGDHAPLPDVAADTDALYEVLAHPRRQFVLACLVEHETELALPDLADELAAWEHDARLPEISAETVADIHTDLYHAHVPKMADAGVIEYDQEHSLVALSHPVDELKDHLNLASFR